MNKKYVAVLISLSKTTNNILFRTTGRCLRALLGLVVLVLLALPAAAQTVTPPLRSDVRKPPSIVRPDTARAAVRRPTTTPDTTGLVRRATPDSMRVAAGGRKGSVETTVKYVAKDSIRFEVQKKIAVLYDDAKVDYGDMNLKAARITVDYTKNLLTAEGQPDTTGRVRGKPVFKNGAETYQAGRINYNFKTKKGKIAEAITQQGEGFLHAETIKKNQLNEIYGRNGRYTTCNLEHPHFYINASKMKVIPGQKVVTGPFNLYIGDIPTPLGFLFGYFPQPHKGRASGLIIPTFGQSTDRGFFLRNGGYYWVPNDNIGVRFTGDIYSGNAQQFGGWRAATEMQYLKRYRYTGLFSFEFSSRPATQILGNDGTSTSAAYRQPRKPQTLWLTWNHTPTPRPGGGRFSASVRAGSSDFNQQNSFDGRRYLTPAFSSTISYSKQLRNLPINYSLNLSQTQNTQSGTMNFTLPDVTLGVARQYPYQWLGLTPRGRFYEQFSISYDLTGQNQFSNTVAARQLSDGLPLLGGTNSTTVLPVSFANLPAILRNSQTGFRHNFGIQLGNYTVLKHFSLTPGINYNASSYFKELNYSYNNVAQAIRIDTVRGFSYAQSWSGSLNLGTTVYGLLPINSKKIQAIRHKITPNLSFNYAPAPNASYNQAPLNLPLGLRYSSNGSIINERTYSRYAGFPYQISGAQQSVLNFSLQNAVEMKVRDDKDTTGNSPFKKVSLIDGLDFNTSYNFAATAFKLSPLTGTFRTQVARKLNLLVSYTFDFYQRDTSGVPIDKYLWDQDNPRFTRLTQAGLQLTYQFNPTQKPGKKSNIPRQVAPVNDPNLGNPIPVNPYEDYVDFDLPWEMNTGFSAQYTDPGPRASRYGYVRPRSLAAASLNLSGSVKLTSNMRIGYSTNYDFINKTAAYTSLDIFRDLHCWQITGNWRPFRGYSQGYYITIAAKSALLQDLKLNRNRTFLNN